MRARKWVIALKVVTGFVLLGWLLTLVEYEEFSHYLMRANAWWLLGAVSAFVAVTILEAIRIWLLFRHEGARPGRVVQLFIESLLFMNLLPGTIGCDGFLVAGLRRVGVAVAAARILFLRLLGVMVLVAMAIVASPEAFRQMSLSIQLGNETIVKILMVGIGACVSGILLLMAFPRFRMLMQLRKAYTAVTTSSAQAIAAVLSTTLLMQLARVLMFMMFVLALGEYLPFSTAILVAAAGLVALVLPVSFSGLGVREAAIAGVLGASGFTASFSIAIALLSRLLMVAGALVGLVLFLSRRAGWSVFSECHDPHAAG